jgi:hypothetical protein
VEEVYYYISDPWQILFQALNTGFLTEGRLQYIAKKFRDVA